MKNNFDFLRLAAAMMVLVDHQFALLLLHAPTFPPGISLGTLGVGIFFSISGYLVTQSWLRDPSIPRFIAKRFLRIWPGLFVVTCFCALIIGPIATSLPIWEYLHEREVRSYFSILGMKMHYNLPGVFLATPYPRALNGSIWSIPLEVTCYIALFVAGSLKLLNFRWIVLVAIIAATLHFFIATPATDVIIYLQIQFGLFFGFGMCLWLFREYWESSRLLVGIVFLLAAGLAFHTHQYLLCYLLAIPFGSVALGSASTPALRRFGRFGDLSYGVYIYAFPVQQTFLWATHARWSFSVYLACTIIVSMALAWLSWHIVEAPALRLKPLGKRQITSRLDIPASSAMAE